MSRFKLSQGPLGLVRLGFAASLALLVPEAATASQAWSCVCKGVTKRYIASTRHCEIRSHLPKGQWCTKEQYRSTYAPACRAQGCKLPRLVGN